MLSDIVRALPNKDVSIALEGTKLQVRCGSARFALATLPVEEYPQLPTMPPVAGSVAADVFAEAIGQVTVAASKDDTLPLLTGEKVEISGEDRKSVGQGKRGDHRSAVKKEAQG